MNSDSCNTVEVPIDDQLFDDGNGSTHVMLHMFQIRKRRPSDRARTAGVLGALPTSQGLTAKSEANSSNALKLKDGRPNRFNIQATTN